MPQQRMVAAGDKACLEKDYIGAKVYYTMAVTKYGEVSDTAGQEAAQKNLDAVEQKIVSRRNNTRSSVKAREKPAGSQGICGEQNHSICLPSRFIRNLGAMKMCRG